ncbi:MAG: LytTR family DNA-binding domain-containing protein [bacterium]
MKVLILDDEPPARRGMRQALAQIGVTDVRDVGTIEQAVKALNEERPDVLLLDVELRGGKVGFDLLDTLPAEGIPAIFITAHPDHALRAFEVRAVDYLLKPVDPRRLKESLKRVSQPTEERPFSSEEKVLFRDGSKNVLLRVGDIQVLEASDAYTRLLLGDGRGVTVNGTLKSVRERLNANIFFLASRSHAVNLDHIANVEDADGGFMILTMANGVKIELSRRQSAEFRELKTV